MSTPSLLAARIRRRVRSELTRLRYLRGWSTLPTGPVRMAPGFRHPIDVHEKPALLHAYRSRFSTAARQELDAAERLLRHDFHLLGHAMPHGERIAWCRDPLSGKDWSHGFSPDISYRGPQRLGDIKLPWELNKLQYFFTLGKAAWLTDDMRFAQEIIDQIDHWIADNPCHSGINWISALEAGTRVVSWILAYPFFASHCGEDFVQRMLRSIAQHLLFVEQHLSVSEYANTHLAGEAAVLVVGALFVECRHSSRWLATGLHHLEEQMHRQVHGDGAHAEQSVAYHRFFLDQYYLVNALLRANGRSLSPAALRRMEQMTQFLMDMLHPDGSAPNFGDGDDARGLWCRSDCTGEYRSLLALGAVLFQRGDFKMVAGDATEELLWLHGTDGLTLYDSLQPRTPDHTSVAYPDAGYYVMRGGWNAADPVLVFDCGPLGYGNAAGHGHADALSFQLYALGYPFLVDSGTYSYNLDYEWRARFRSSRAHNTIFIDSLDQSAQRDRMSWTTFASAQCRRWVTTPWFDLVDGEHDGYARLPAAVTHRRVIAFIKPDLWIVCDQLLGQVSDHAVHDFEWLLHLLPDCRPDTSSRDGAVSMLAPNGSTLHVPIAGRLLQDGPAQDLGCNVIDDWYSGRYGEKVQSRSLCCAGRVTGSTTIVTCLSTTADVHVDISLVYGMLEITALRPSAAATRLLYRIADARPYSAVDPQFDGSLLFERGKAGHTEVLWSS